MRKHLPWIVTLAALFGLVWPSAQTVISNNAADMANHIVMVADSTTPRTVSNLFTFNRSGSAPFAVASSSASVDNLLNWKVITSTATGTQNDFAPGIAGNTVVRMNNATLTTITGLAAGIDGQHVKFVSIGAGQVDLPHQNAGSAATARFINYATVGSTSLAAGVGTAEFIYDNTTQRWRLIEHDQGTWITPTFAAGNYTGIGTMTWTLAAGDRLVERYYLRGRQLHYETVLATTTVGGAVNTDLRAAIPGGLIAASLGANGLITGPCFYSDNAGAMTVGRVYGARAVLTSFEIEKIDASNWTAAADTTTVQFNVVLEVQ